MSASDRVSDEALLMAANAAPQRNFSFDHITEICRELLEYRRSADRRAQAADVEAAEAVARELGSCATEMGTDRDYKVVTMRSAAALIRGQAALLRTQQAALAECRKDAAEARGLLERAERVAVECDDVDLRNDVRAFLQETK